MRCGDTCRGLLCLGLTLRVSCTVCEPKMLIDEPPPGDLSTRDDGLSRMRLALVAVDVIVVVHVRE